MHARELAAAGIFDADHAPLVDQKAGGQRAGFDREVRPAHHRMQVGARRALALAAADKQLDAADPLALLAVIIVAYRQAVIGDRLLKRLVEVLRMVRLRDPDGSIAAVIGALAAPARFQALEVGQHVGVAPALQPLLAPQVEIAPVPARFRPVAPARAEGLELRRRAALLQAPGIELARRERLSRRRWTHPGHAAVPSAEPLRAV